MASFCVLDIALGSLEVGSGSESSSKEPEISQGRICECQYFPWYDSSRHYYNFSGSHQLEGACIIKKDNRTFSPKVSSIFKAKYEVSNNIFFSSWPLEVLSHVTSRVSVGMMMSTLNALTSLNAVVARVWSSIKSE